MTDAELAELDRVLSEVVPFRYLPRLDDLVGEVERLADENARQRALLQRAYDHGFAWLFDARHEAQAQACPAEYAVGEELRKALGIR